MGELTKYCPKCKLYYSFGAYKKCPKCKTKLIAKKVNETEDRCPKCDKKLNYYDYSLGECKKCHTPIKTHEKVEKYKCPECGTKNLDSDKFCHSCGFKLKEESERKDKIKEVGISDPVWLGVKIGFGMFIVLPLLIILIIIILGMLLAGC